MTQPELLPALQFTPPIISLNFEALEKRICDITETYTGLVVQEDDVPAIKYELAGLNRLAGQLADARKDAVSRISGPIKEFEGKVKGLESKILETRSFLDEQVKNHIERERNSKRHAVEVIIADAKDQNGIPGLDIPVQESWLNKTVKPKIIAAEVANIILAHKRRQEEKAALEQAGKDRIIALENHKKVMEQSRAYTLSFSLFGHLQSLELPLSEALNQVEEMYVKEDKRLAALEEAQEIPSPHAQAKQQSQPVQQQQPTRFTYLPAAQESAAPRIVKKAMIISATYSAENGPAIQALYAQIKALCCTCTYQVAELAPPIRDGNPFAEETRGFNAYPGLQ